MNDVLNTASAFLLTFAVHGTVAAVLACGLAAVTRARGERAIALWRFGLAAGLVTSVLQMLLAPCLTIDLAPLLPRMVPVTEHVALEPMMTLTNAGEGPAAMPAVHAAPNLSAWPLGLCAAAVSLACLGLTGLFRAQRGLSRVLALRTPEDDPRILAAAAVAATQYGLKRTPHLSRSDVLRTPVAFGIGVPEICLPRRTRELGDDELHAMLAHELAHLVHRDAVWLWLGALLQALFPWHLPLRVCRVRLHHAVELRCDARAAAQTNGVAVASCLLQVAEWMRGALRSPRGALAMAARPSSLQQRVDAALQHDGFDLRRHPLRASLLAAVAMVALVAAVPGVGPRPAVEDEVAAVGGGLASAPAPSPALELTLLASELAQQEDALLREAANLRAELGAAAQRPATAALLLELDQRLQALARARQKVMVLLARRGHAPAIR